MKILLVIAVPFLGLAVWSVYRFLGVQRKLEKQELITLSDDTLYLLARKIAKKYSEDLNLITALDLMVETLKDSVSFTSASFLIPVDEGSSDYVFREFLSYEVSEDFVNLDKDCLENYVKENLGVEVENISRQVEGGPINSASSVKALSRVVYPIEAGSVKGVFCLTSRKRNQFSAQLEKDLKNLSLLCSEYFTLIWEVAKREHGKFKAMVDSMRDGVFMVDENYRFLIANPALKRMLSLRSTEGANIVRVSNFFGVHLSIEDVISEVFALGKIKTIEDLHIDGKYYGLVAIPVTVRKNVVGVVCLLEDQTKDHELDQMHRDFSAMIIHELRAPLSVIRGTSDFLVKETANIEEDQRENFIQQIRVSSDTLLSLVNNLLDSAKIESGKIELFRENVNLNDLVKSSVESYTPSAKQKNIGLAMDLDASFPTLNLDSSKMNQVLSNLISNGLKYTPEGGGVSVGTSLGDGVARLFVADTGRGIADENKESVFDKYKRAEKDAEVKGTGLGLAISQGIVNAHGGKIWVEDNEPTGSRFIVELPL